MIKDALAKVIEGTDLTREESYTVMNEIMSGECTDTQIGAYLTALRIKGETVEEIAGATIVMREKATVVPAPEGCIDIVGTGGDCQKTFNISTCSAIVAAAAGAIVAKHGSRAVSSSSGASQVLESLGVNVNASVETVSHCISEVGIGFLFAPVLHSAMKHAVGPRKEMGVRTIFNILGPLTNPAGAKRQVMGVYARDLVDPMAEVLRELGSERIMVVHGHDGLDEISITEETSIAQYTGDEVQRFVIAPEEFDMKRASIEELRVDSPEESAGVIHSVLDGVQGATRDIVLLNTAAALFVADIASDLADGIEKAAEAIDSGKGRDTLSQLIKLSNV